MSGKGGRVRRVALAQAKIVKQKAAAVAVDGAPLEVPDVITFVTSPRYLNRPNLYPGQALLLKVIFLAIELLTPHDHATLEAWGRGFTAVGEPGDRHFEGGEGMPPDVLARMHVCRSQGRRWFREVVLVIGRRGSKGYVGALAAAYIIWHYLALADPQEHYNIERTKQLTGMFFAGEHSQSAKNLFQDVARLIKSAPCFEPYVASAGTFAVSLATPRDLAEGRGRSAARLASSASIVLDARPSTGLAGRGPAAFLTMFDELAHLGVDTARSADEVYESAVPALDQFGVGGFILQASSPASQLGKFHTSYQAALALDDDDVARDPTMITLQLPSWGLYEGWELTTRDEGLPMYPDGPNFAPLTRALVVYDEQMRRKEQANPAVFAVEHRAQWRTSMDAFLAASLVAKIFAPYDGELLQFQDEGRLGTKYVMHIDPAKNGANFAIAIGHAGHPNKDGLRAVIYDAIHVRRPRDYDDGEIDQIECFNLIKKLIRDFHPIAVTFDQHNSALSIEMLREWCHSQTLPVQPNIYEEPATAKHNKEVADLFKSAVGLGLVHSPDHPLARAELLHLQERHGKVDAPTRGPVQTADITDAMFEVAHYLISQDIERYLRLGALPLGMSQPGGFKTWTPTPENSQPYTFPTSLGGRRGPRWPPGTGRLG